MKVRIRWTNPLARAIVLGVMLVLIALYAGDAFHFVYQAY